LPRVGEEFTSLEERRKGWFWFVEDRNDNGGQVYMAVMS